MLKRLKDFLTAPTPGSSEIQKNNLEMIRLATAALLVEAALMDGVIEPIELKTIKNLLSEYFLLSSEEVQELVSEGETKASGSTDLYGLTKIIKDNFSQEDRIYMIEMLWEVAYTDGSLDHLEDNLIRRIAGLIYVPEIETGEARRRVRENLKINHL